MGIYDKVVNAAKGAAAAVKAGNSETEGIGSELAERAKMNRLAMGKSDEAKPVDKESVSPTAGGNSPYGSRKGEKKLDTSYLDKPTAVKAPVYDKGGKIIGGTNIPARVYDKGGKVDVNDGKHQVAILKEGERVLTEKQDKEYQKTKGEHAEPDADDYDDGGKVHTPEEKNHFARSMNHLNAGGLHRHLGISEDKPIPHSKKVEASKSDNPHVAAMGRLAVAMSGWKHPKKK
jgi:hypothetical protein